MLAPPEHDSQRLDLHGMLLFKNFTWNGWLLKIKFSRIYYHLQKSPFKFFGSPNKQVMTIDSCSKCLRIWAGEESLVINMPSSITRTSNMLCIERSNNLISPAPAPKCFFHFQMFTATAHWWKTPCTNQAA